ncbi:MAG: hypothetical protein IPO94_12535 [Saprospiraceae bacterium]|nr:hypothetical protein [Saprospiraceae bacterium]
MVAIKLPDLFHSMIWDTKNIIPFVGVQTPNLLPGFTYTFYYHNGYSELIKDVNAAFYEQVKYFYIMVKYSSDYLLLNTDNLTNEKNISLYEFLPQIEYCTKNILLSDTDSLESKCHKSKQDLIRQTKNAMPSGKSTVAIRVSLPILHKIVEMTVLETVTLIIH